VKDTKKGKNISKGAGEEETRVKKTHWAWKKKKKKKKKKKVGGEKNETTGGEDRL